MKFMAVECDYCGKLGRCPHDREANSYPGGAQLAFADEDGDIASSEDLCKSCMEAIVKVLEDRRREPTKQEK